MFDRRNSKEVYVIIKEIDARTHHLMDIKSNEKAAVDCVMKTYPQAEMEEEIVGQYGVSKNLHFTPVRDGNRITIRCMEPDTSIYNLE